MRPSALPVLTNTEFALLISAPPLSPEGLAATPSFSKATPYDS
jgi:hypothetical protein